MSDEVPGAYLKGDGPNRMAPGAGSKDPCAGEATQTYEPVSSGVRGRSMDAGACGLFNAAPGTIKEGKDTATLTGATTTAPGRGITGQDGAGSSVPPAPLTYEGWLLFLAQAASLRQLGISLAWGCRSGHTLLVERSAGPLHSSVSTPHSGGMFPLPVIWPDDFSDLWRVRGIPPIVQIFQQSAG